MELPLAKKEYHIFMPRRTFEEDFPITIKDSLGRIWKSDGNSTLVGTPYTHPMRITSSGRIENNNKRKQWAVGKNVVHGANSHTILSTRSGEVAEALISNFPWILETDRVGIEQYCRAEARARLLDEYIWSLVDEEGVESVPRHLWDVLSHTEANAMKAASALGLNPESRLRIAKDAGIAKHFSQVDLKELMSKGRNLRLANE